MPRKKASEDKRKKKPTAASKAAAVEEKKKSSDEIVVMTEVKNDISVTVDSDDNARPSNAEPHEVDASVTDVSFPSVMKNPPGRAPTVAEIISDPITQLAVDHWAQRQEHSTSSKYSADMVKKIFEVELVGLQPSRIQLLEMSGYLENYLWPHFDVENVAMEHSLSIILLVNEKCRVGTNIDFLAADEKKCTSFCAAVFDYLLDGYTSKVSSATSVLMENDSILAEYFTFMINVFKSLENSVLRKCTLRYVSMPIWTCLSAARLNQELIANPSIAQRWVTFLEQKNSVDQLVESSDTNHGSSKKRGRKAKTESKLDPEMQGSKGGSGRSSPMHTDSYWLYSFLCVLLDKFKSLSIDAAATSASCLVVAKGLEFVTDLLSQLPTRRFLKALLDDIHFISACRMFNPQIETSDVSVEVSQQQQLLVQLIAMADEYLHFEIDERSGEALTTQDVIERSVERINALQQIAYKEFPEKLRDLVFTSVGELAKEGNLRRHLQLLEPTELLNIAEQLRIVAREDIDSNFKISDDKSNRTNGSIQRRCWINLSDETVLRDLIIAKLASRPRHIDALNMSPIYPNEQTIWDLHQLPVNAQHTGREALALPKLNVQFLTMHDYLLRNYKLFSLESAYEIREDLMYAIKHMGPKQSLRGETTFSGWARMALPITDFSIDVVSRPHLGKLIPEHVDSTITIDLSRFSGEIRREWEDLREHDVVFLLCIDRPRGSSDAVQSDSDKLGHGKKRGEDFVAMHAEEVAEFPKRYGIKYIRGGCIFEMRDEADVVLNDPSRPDERQAGRAGSKRKLCVHLDPAQYYEDMKTGTNCYDRMNLLVRRDPKSNNFKAILETIRSLINTASVGRAIPDWLHDVFLGYGSSTSAHYRTIATAAEEEHDYRDTFLDPKHVIESFPHATEISFCSADGKDVMIKGEGANILADFSSLPMPPYRLRIVSCISDENVETNQVKSGKRKRGTASTSDAATEKSKYDRIEVTPLPLPSPGPYPEDISPKNNVRYTATQVEAIRSGINPGLTMIVGPPGTGKTDVAVQIITTLYHNYPNQKLLIVTHSNAALNDIFEKIMERDVAPRHLLRLGSGESELRDTLAIAGAKGSGKGQGEAFSKMGRVSWSLMRRLQLLAQVQRLAQSIGVSGDIGASCETAEYFHMAHIRPLMEKFHNAARPRGVDATADGVDISKVFPFSAFFSDTPKPLFHTVSTNQSNQQNYDAACGCFRHINRIFEELRDYRAFELLRTQHLRSDFLLTKQARIVAMTCTHAAMTRDKLVQLGFKYDSIIMEEAAQILEVETLIPMLLQDKDPVEGNRLKRVVLIGDHYQLPPVVRHHALQKFSHLEQSMFTRFIRLGIPSVHLDQQGRARKELADLYRWRYQHDVSDITQNHIGKGFLGDMQQIQSISEFTKANAGFVHTYQFIDVPNFQNKGEQCPTPHFFQNLGEAEYIVAVYQYMRLIGYPAEKISIITTYNGQKHLLRDILKQRCMNPIFGMPAHVTTVDKFQGQQNDYVLLSMVRTEHVGHIRDVRRLIVALSRARLGLYIFGHLRLFQNCYELATPFDQLMQRPVKLQLVAGEAFPTSRSAPSAASESIMESECFDSSMVHEVPGVTEMGVLVYQMVQQAQHLVAR